LWHQQRYRERRGNYTKTRPTAVSIGERRRPNPQGQPGYVRVDTVHQGDRPGAKGIYHINAVDEVTQGQIVGATARISEVWPFASVAKTSGPTCRLRLVIGITRRREVEC
jgi:hypothetical protein